MSKTTYAGLNYAGHSGANQDKATGIHYGVIPSNSLSPFALDDIYSNGTDLNYESWKEEVKTSVQSSVESALDSFMLSSQARRLAEAATEAVMDSDWLGEGYESNGESSYLYEDGDLKIQLCSDGDIFVIKSPFVCNAQYCSPCAPGAGYLPNPCDSGPVCYCLPEDWFDSENPCPYSPRPVEEAFPVA